MAAHKTIADLPKVVKWDDEPIEIWIDVDKEDTWSDGYSITCTPELALELAASLITKASLALAGKYEHHYEGENGEEID
jgi:hypothetical protein